MDSEKINQVRKRIVDQINSHDDSILRKYPTSEYIKLSDRYPAVHDYQYVSQEIKSFTEQIVKSSNEKILELYHQIVLLDLITRNIAILENKDLPESIKLLYRHNFQRIVTNIETDTGPNGFYLHDHDKFLKDWGICTGWIIPAGAYKINIDSISKRFLFKKDLRQFVRGLAYVMIRLGGFKPFYIMHTDSHDPSSIGDYTEEGFTRAFIRVAQLLKLNPGIKGIYCVGWLNDPKLSEISPRLAFARTIFTDNGGVIFYIGPSQSAVENATAKSATRKRLYQEGKYIPTEYIAIWSRNKLLAWADRFTKSKKNMIALYNLTQDKIIMDATRTKDKLIEEINNYDSRLLTKYPTSVYIGLSDEYPTVPYYQYVIPGIKSLTEKIISNGNENILEIYHKIILLELIIRNTPIIKCGDLPEPIKSLYFENYQRIIDGIGSDTELPGFYLHQNEKYFKVLGICAMRLIPAGARKINIIRLPRRFLIKKGIRQFFEGLAFLLFELRGIQPLYRMHLDSHDPNLLAKFNPEGHQAFFLNVAKLLRKNKNIKGIFGNAWFYDPKLSEINNRYDYLRKMVTDNGGKIFYNGTDQSAIENAIAKSPTRKRLYNERKYSPANYIIIWGRKKIIEWADNFIK